MRAAVVGAGAAGAAAAWALARDGAEVTMFTRGPGASAMTSGAADLEPWTAHSPHRPLEPLLQTFLHALEFYPLRAGSTVATSAGILRPARLADPLLLDFAQLAPGRVLVVDVGRSDFDARRLCRALAEVPGPHAFEALAVPGVFTERERRLPLAACWATFSKAHAGRLGEGVTRALGSRSDSSGAPPVVGVLIGPFLGTDRALLDPLAALRLPVGEVTSPPEGPAGERLAGALRALVASVGVKLEAAEVLAVRPTGARVHLEFVSASAEPTRVESFDGCVLASGGLVAGGLVPSITRPSRPTSPLIDADDALVGSLRGFDAAEDGGRFLGPHSSIGLDERHLAPGVFVAGDVQRGAPLTVLGAARDGLAAAERLISALRLLASPLRILTSPDHGSPDHGSPGHGKA